MKKFVFSAAMALMLLGGTTFAMATGGHGGGGGGGGGSSGGGSSGGGSTGGASSASEKDGAPGADRDAQLQGAGECERLVEQRKIGQSGPASGAAVNAAGQDCDPNSGAAR